MQRQALISDLIAATAADRVITDPAELFVYESDGFTIAHARPAAVVFVISTEEVQKVFAIHLENRVAHVQAGVRNTALSDAVSQLPLDVESSLAAQEPPATSSPTFDPVDSMAGQAIS